MGTPVSSAAFPSECRGDSTLPSPAFYRAVYSQIEEVGWEHLMGAAEDLSCLTFRRLDKKGRVHILEISLPRNYPESSPTIAADVPCINEVVWSEKSRLKDVVQQFDEHLQKLQEFWSTMDDIDRDLCVVYPKESSLATSYCQIGLGNDCYLLLHISTSSPRSLPECRFFGPDSAVVLMRNNWKKNAIKWKVDKPFHENLAALLERELPGPSVSSKDDGQVDCGICYAQYLPVGNTMNLELTAEVHRTIPAKILVAVKLFIPYASEIGCIPLQQRGSHLMFCLETAPIVLNLSQLKLITDINSEINNSLSTTRMSGLVLLVNRRVIQVHDHEEGPIKSIDQVVQNEIMLTAATTINLV